MKEYGWAPVVENVLARGWNAALFRSWGHRNLYAGLRWYSRQPILFLGAVDVSPGKH